MIIFTKPKRKVNKVFLHCSANSNSKWGILELKTSHLSRGFSDIGYHYFIDFTGTIFEGRSLEKAPAAQKNHNTGTIAICLHGGRNSVNDFTQEQFNSLKFLCNQINAEYKKEITFHGHKEVGKTDCPVFDYKEVLSLDEKGYMQQKTKEVEEPTFIDFLKFLFQKLKKFIK